MGPNDRLFLRTLASAMAGFRFGVDRLVGLRG